MRRSIREQHVKHVQDLERVLGYTLRENEEHAFREMLHYLEPKDVALSDTRVLSRKQLDWLASVLARHEPQYENLFSSGKVPVGNPDVVVNVGPKVLKPPGRRAG